MLNWADYAILAILGLSVLVGLWRGFVSEVLALVVWVAAFWLAWTFGPAVAGYFEHSIDVPSVRILVGYGLCFIAVLVLGALLRYLMSRLVQGTGLTGSDRMLGMLFGLLRGLLLVSLLVFLLGFTPFTRDPWWKQSQLLPTFTGIADWLGDRVPASVKRYLHPPDVLKPLTHRLQGLPDKAASTMPAAAAASAPATPASAARH